MQVGGKRTNWAVESKINSPKSKQNKADKERYQELREAIARKTPSIIHISNKRGVPDVLYSYSATASGGSLFSINIYESILQNNPLDQIPNQRKLDALNTLIGLLDEKINSDFIQIVNPFYWLGCLLETIFRIPFWLLSKTGFEMSRIENHFLSRVFKLLEVVTFVYFTLRFIIPETWIESLFFTFTR